jgi:hypothetical protein
MAVALPVIAAFASGAAGVAAIGAATTVLGTIAAYATVAGAIMTGVGALTGKRDLMKIGGILSLGGSLGTLASNAAGTAASSSGGFTGGGAAVDEITAEAAGAGGGAAGAAETIGSAASGVPATAPQFVSMGGDAGAQAPGLMEAAQARSMQGATTVPLSAPTNVSAPIQDYAQGLTSNDMQSFWDRVKGLGKTIENNPNTAKLIGQTVQGGVQAYGQAQQEALLQEQNDYQRSLIERARANLNRPIRITYGSQS